MMMTKMKWVLILMLLPSMVAGQSLIPAPRRMEKISDRIFRFENVEEKIRVTPDSTLEYLDILSDNKVNMFHWHLTDHPGWRIECRAYPQLNNPKTGIAGRDEGLFYTYDEIRDVIRYARERGITVIPPPSCNYGRIQE